MNEELEVLKIVTKRLDENNISYMVTGSVAMNFYAMPRMTRDIDIVLEISEKDAPRLMEMFCEDFYINQEMIINAVRSQGMFNIIHNDYVIKIDFIVRKDNPYRKTEFQRRRKVKVDSVWIWLVTVEDLILSKLWWAKQSRSERQFEDIKNILSQVKDIDKKYLEKWVRNLGIYTLYEELSDE